MIVQIDIKHLKKQNSTFLAGLQDAMDQSMREGGERGKQHSFTTTKFKGSGSPGGLRKSTAFRIKRGKFSGRVIFTNKHPGAAAQDGGSGLHGPKRAKYPIRPKGKKSLRFTVGGNVIFSKGVMHPGVKPTHFLRDANKAGFRRTIDALESRVRVLAKRFGRF